MNKFFYPYLFPIAVGAVSGSRLYFILSDLLKKKKYINNNTITPINKVLNPGFLIGLGLGISYLLYNRNAIC
jgi:hypothetical protein